MIVIVYSERSVGPQVETVVDGYSAARDWVSSNPIDKHSDGIYQLWEGETGRPFVLLKEIWAQESRDLGRVVAAPTGDQEPT